MLQNIPVHRLRGGNPTNGLPSGKASNPPWRVQCHFQASMWRKLEGKLDEKLFKFSQNKITGQWHRKCPRRPCTAGPPTRDPPEVHNNKNCCGIIWSVFRADRRQCSGFMLRPRHRFFLVSLCLKANAEMVPKVPSCHYMLLMSPSRLKFSINQFHVLFTCKITTATQLQ